LQGEHEDTNHTWNLPDDHVKPSIELL
jgi:hypothetical protein